MATPGTKAARKKAVPREEKKAALHEDKYQAVKIDRKLGGRLRVIAAESNESVGDCLSRLSKEPIEREWAKILRKRGDTAP